MTAPKKKAPKKKVAPSAPVEKPKPHEHKPTMSKEELDLRGITSICQHVGYSDLTVLNWHYRNGLPLALVKGVWWANKTELLKWIQDNNK